MLEAVYAKNKIVVFNLKKTELVFYYRWETIGAQLSNLVKTLLRRFRWGFVLAGFSALAMAAISWKLESSESYWIWHRYYEIL